ncbi:serine--tRNA ligase [Alisedimentitalea sp. MJ-SS2]|uniref:serine--tRNA ligase n=1 Tax=Aliisedimentitalea sp. MJ-SS2 TaxID=3049795 RepID=UPI00290EFCD4|nr:serine--tRNA ligase [Alisedimentitalea sp. MJ-SS2]MDU8926403.1 serine--tRNA ligase [Alisedimentitalea sp. MJ-SS2]
MHDIRAIRENPAAFDAAIARRGDAPMSSSILELDEARRAKILAAETAQADQNKAAKAIGAAKAAGNDDEFNRLREEVAAKKAEVAAMQTEAKDLDRQLTAVLETIPNLAFEDVPIGADEDDNVEIHRWGTPREMGFTAKEHYELDGVKPGMNFELAAKLSGSRFVVLQGAIARIHRALAQFMIDTHIEENGLTETWAPVLVRNDMMYGTGQLPKFAEDSYFGATLGGRTKLGKEALTEYKAPSDIDKLCNGGAKLEDVVEEIYERAPTSEELWLIPTSEVTLTNIVNGETVDEATLPQRYCAHSQCFRSEAGSAGRDTSGMLRQHQFEKVEMVSITHPDNSRDELDRMTKCAEGILEKLGLPYRTIVLCTGDMGFGAQRTHDIEVWLPGQNTYREISSVSVCGDFQARRMNARFKPAEGGKPQFVHTLNGSGLAVGRCLIAVLENGQQEDGSVDLPEALQMYLRGKTRLTALGELV